MVAQIDFLAVDKRSDGLPGAADCPAVQVVLEVVPHPAGGWTLAEPVDATVSSLRIYRGCWTRRQDAEQAAGGMAV